MDFGNESINAAWTAQDANRLVAALDAAGWVRAGTRDYAGAPSIRVLPGRDVVVDRYPASSPFVLLITTRAQFSENLGGDSIRDGENGSRMVTPPQRVVYELDLSPDEIRELGL